MQTERSQQCFPAYAEMDCQLGFMQRKGARALGPPDTKAQKIPALCHTLKMRVCCGSSRSSWESLQRTENKPDTGLVGSSKTWLKFQKGTSRKLVHLLYGQGNNCCSYIWHLLIACLSSSPKETEPKYVQLKAYFSWLPLPPLLPLWQG